MALTDGMMFIIVAQIGLHQTLCKHSMRGWRMMGYAAMILVGWSAGAVEDTGAALVFFLISLMIAGIPLMEEVSAMVD